MSIFAQASKSDRLKIRRGMLREAERLLVGIYPGKAQRKAAARMMVDAAIARERKTDGETEHINAQTHLQ